jgi:N-acetyl-gamma-glutamyl-phosphate reductase
VSLRVAVAGASGYAGGELVRLIAGHPEFELVTVTANSNAGKPLGSVHPHLSSLELTLEETTAKTLSGHDVVFLALPHGKSGELGDAIDARLIVDCGADHRLASEKDWAEFYGGHYSTPWTYGMPELSEQLRLDLATATRIAVPGCNATAVTFAFAPMITHNMIDRMDAIDTSHLTSVLAVGVSGAGKSLRNDLLASEVLGSASAYAVGGIHRHNPEIVQNLVRLNTTNAQLSFTPILVPMSRGILAVNSAPLRGASDVEGLRYCVEEFYGNSRFVTLLPEGQQPRTADVLGSNSVHIQVALDERASRAVITVAIDNLGKGTAGAAIQSANIALGFDEALGLTAIGIAP